MQQIGSVLGTKVFLVEDFSDLSFQVGTLGNDILWVCDSNTARMVRPLPDPHVILEPGESAKSLNSVERIVSVALENHLGRESTFLALGGGVVCDVTAFAASVYMRGCKVAFIPTTLLAMVDASVGGKCGVNFQNGKNIIGSFYPANNVYICPDCLKSLGEREYINGLAEVIKHSILTKDESLYLSLVQNKKKILEKDSKVLSEIIRLSLEIKAQFIEQDPQDNKGMRNALNLGHTFGHALESLSRMQWSHGQAVAWGTCRAMEAAFELSLCPKEFSQGVKKLFAFYGYDIQHQINRGEWIDFRNQLEKDKKRIGNRIKFVLLKGQGEFVLSELDEELIKKLVIRGAGVIEPKG